MSQDSQVSAPSHRTWAGVNACSQAGSERWSCACAPARAKAWKRARARYGSRGYSAPSSIGQRGASHRLARNIISSGMPRKPVGRPWECGKTRWPSRKAVVSSPATLRAPIVRLLQSPTPPAPPLRNRAPGSSHRSAMRDRRNEVLAGARVLTSSNGTP